jgi:hypothetical protein
MRRLIAIKSETDYSLARESSGEFGHTNGSFRSAIPIRRDHQTEPDPMLLRGPSPSVQQPFNNLFVRPKPPSQEPRPDRHLSPDSTIRCGVLNDLSDQTGQFIGTAYHTGCGLHGVPERLETSTHGQRWDWESRRARQLRKRCGPHSAIEMKM